MPNDIFLPPSKDRSVPEIVSGQDGIAWSKADTPKRRLASDASRPANFTRFDSAVCENTHTIKGSFRASADDLAKS